MTSRDWTLLLLRGFGLYLLILTLGAIPELIVSAYAVVAAWGAETPFAEEVRERFASRAIASAIHLILYGAAGCFLLRGEPVLRWLRLPGITADQTSQV